MYPVTESSPGSLTSPIVSSYVEPSWTLEAPVSKTVGATLSTVIVKVVVWLCDGVPSSVARTVTSAVTGPSGGVQVNKPELGVDIRSGRSSVELETHTISIGVGSCDSEGDDATFGK